MNLPGGARGLDAAAVGQYAAVRLFIERATAIRPAFAVTNENAPAVAGIAARLAWDAAGHRARGGPGQAPSPDAILSRLEHQLDVLASGGARPARPPADPARRHRLEL